MFPVADAKFAIHRGGTRPDLPLLGMLSSAQQILVAAILGQVHRRPRTKKSKKA
jgi:hypothetical protein